MNYELIVQIIFGLSVVLLFYTYIGYPLFVYLVSLAAPKSISKAAFEPTVTILITAYNEEKAIRKKLDNTLAIEYPKEKLEILVASDGSSDATDEIVKEFAKKGVKLFHQVGRKGKTYTQNKAVENATGEIILFSDATTDYQTNVLSEILPNFSDQNVGCAAGKLVYIDKADSDVGKAAKSYWNYETFIKESESRACSLIGASGCLYAVRKSAYQPMYPEACSDFLICTVVYRQGLRSVYEPKAVCMEETNNRTDKEIKMRVRVISQTFTDLWRNLDMLNPFKSGFYAIELISHKVLRYSVPIFLLLVFLTSAILSFANIVFLIILLLQVVFYTIALFTWVLEKNGVKLGMLAIPQYFVLTNFASMVGFYKFLKGERYATWEPIREKSENQVSASDHVV